MNFSELLIIFLTGAFCSTHYSFWMSMVGLKIRAAIVTLVYRKTLHSSNVKLTQEFTFGEIVNYMSTDADRVVNSCPSFHTFWSIPLQVKATSKQCVFLEPNLSSVSAWGDVVPSL